MNITSPYWTPPAIYSQVKSQKPIANTLGFQFLLPWQGVSTAGFYYGENPIPGRRELVFSGTPEYYATQNIIPASGNVPLYNPYDKIYQYSRADQTILR